MIVTNKLCWFRRITIGPLLLLFVLSIQFCTKSGHTKLFDLYEKSEQYEEKQEEESADNQFSIQTIEERKQEYEFWMGIYDQLQKIDRSALQDGDQISYDIFKRDVLREIKAYEFKEYLIPINHEGGFHTRPISMANNMSADSIKEYEDYITRLNSMPEYFGHNISLMKEGLDSSKTLPKTILVEEYKQVIELQIVDNPKESTFYQPFEELPSSISKKDRKRLREQAQKTITESVVSSYSKFLEFMKNEYMVDARKKIGLSSYSGGDKHYKYLVKYYTTLDVTPKEVHQIGLDEVKRIRSEMKAIIDNVNFQGSFNEFLNFLRTDPQFYVEESEELMERAAHIAKRMDGKLPKYFNKLPQEPYGIEPVPDHLAPRYTGGRYSPADDSTDAGYYWVNTYDLNSRPLYTLEALTFHEAVPGHHLQIALADELENLSEIRQEASVTVFVEGWALYAERLGLEAGFYQNPYSNFGRLTYEMWRACRLVVDTGIHAFGWDREKAVNFMKKNTALSNHEINTEVNRYIAGPGQALAYKMGELKIRELRTKAKQKLGSEFNIREFHDAVLLGGAMPLAALEKQINQYIKENSSGS